MIDGKSEAAPIADKAVGKARRILVIITMSCAAAFLVAYVMREDKVSLKGTDSFFTVASASIEGQYHRRVVDALCRPYNEAHAEGSDRCLAVPTSGSVMNLECLRAGQVDFALAQADTCLESDAAPLPAPEEGKARIRCAGLAGKTNAMAVLGRTHVESLHILTRRGFAGARTLDDLAMSRGETIRIDIGKPGSGTQRAARYVLDLAGIDLDAEIVDEKIDPETGEKTRDSRPRFELRQFEPNQLVSAICDRTALDIGFYMIGGEWLDDAPVRLNDPCDEGSELVLLPLPKALDAASPYRIGALGDVRVLEVDAYLLAGREGGGATPERRAALQALLDRSNGPTPDDLPDTCYHPGIVSQASVVE